MIEKSFLVTDEFCRVKFYGPQDLSIPFYLERVKTILDSFDILKKATDINSILELYNTSLILNELSSDISSNSSNDAYVSEIKKVVSIFFNSIDGSSFVENVNKICYEYFNDFWMQIVSYQVYKKISKDLFISLLNDKHEHISYVLSHKKLVDYLDEFLAEFLRGYENFCKVLIDNFLVETSSKTKLYLPPSLKKDEYESIISSYMDEHDDLDCFRLVLNCRSSDEFPISDKLKLKAKRKQCAFYQCFEKSEHSKYKFSVNISFRPNSKIVTISNHTISNQNAIYDIVYDIDWLNNHRDYPTILNNFIYIFNFVDYHCRFFNTTLRSSSSSIEEFFRVRGKEEYSIGINHKFESARTLAVLETYSNFLMSNNISFDSIINWFFTVYLKDEFHVEKYISELRLKDRSVFEKCRNIASELDGIFKQFSLYVNNGEIDSELLEISSNHVFFKDIPSLIKNKYAYACSEDLNKEIDLLFSMQYRLYYVKRFNNGNSRSFYDLANKYRGVLNVKDYHEDLQHFVYWLNERGSILISSDGFVSLNKTRVALLRDLYYTKVICTYKYADQSEINRLISENDISCESTLFSKPEQDFLNYVMNKSQFGNSLDLRNKYIHCSFPHNDEEQQNVDYLILLKIIILVVLKINDEFCSSERLE